MKLQLSGKFHLPKNSQFVAVGCMGHEKSGDAKHDDEFIGDI